MLGEVTALGAAVCWTLSAVLYKVALSDTKPVSANISRCISTTIFFVACLVVAGRVGDLLTLQPYTVALAGLSGVVGLCLGDTTYMLSLKLIGVSRAVPVTCTYPLFTILFEAVFLGGNVTLFLLMSAVLIVLGIWLISQMEDKLGNLTRHFLPKGIFVALFTAVVWAVGIIMMDHAQRLSELSATDAALVLNSVRIFTTTSAFLALSPLIDRKFRFIRLKRRTWVVLALGGIVALGLGWFLLTVSLSYIQPSRAVPISSISPLFATLFGALLLKEKVTLKIFIGSAMIVLGTAGVFVV
jgi:DME family drug/metabolite transporter